MDQRPKLSNIQVNIHNPNDNGHVLATIFKVDDFNLIEDIEEIKNIIIQDKIDSLIQKAERHFGVI